MVDGEWAKRNGLKIARRDSPNPAFPVIKYRTPLEMRYTFPRSYLANEITDLCRNFRAFAQYDITPIREIASKLVRV
jgi:hypothetical protein